MSLHARSTHLLSNSRYEDSTTFMHRLFQFFLMLNLNLPWCNLRPLLCVLSCRLRKETETPLSAGSEVGVESNEVFLHSFLPFHSEICVFFAGIFFFLDYYMHSQSTPASHSFSDELCTVVLFQTPS